LQSRQKQEILLEKQLKQKKGCGPNKHKTLSSNPSSSPLPPKKNPTKMIKLSSVEERQILPDTEFSGKLHTLSHT
jgi:hypothetical protein